MLPSLAVPVEGRMWKGLMVPEWPRAKNVTLRSGSKPSYSTPPTQIKHFISPPRSMKSYYGVYSIRVSWLLLQILPTNIWGLRRSGYWFRLQNVLTVGILVNYPDFRCKILSSQQTFNPKAKKVLLVISKWDFLIFTRFCPPAFYKLVALIYVCRNCFKESLYSIKI